MKSSTSVHLHDDDFKVDFNDISLWIQTEDITIFTGKPGRAKRLGEALIEVANKQEQFLMNQRKPNEMPTL